MPRHTTRTHTLSHAFTHSAHACACKQTCAQTATLGRLLTGGVVLACAATFMGALSGCSSQPPAHKAPTSIKLHTKAAPRLLPDVAPIALQGSYASRPDVMAQVPDMARRLNLPENFVRNALGNANFLPRVPRLIMPAKAGARSTWRVYRSRFVEPIRIRAGVNFWRQNLATLQRAEREYGVPARYIVGIIGVETIYGRNTGNMRVLDTLATLSFDFPQEHPRAEARTRFFRGELEAYLQLCASNDDDPQSIRGSYAGAIGLPQFMPSNIIKHAEDYDQDGHIDLFGSQVDAIGSVASYFKAHGWVNGLPPLYDVAFDQSRLQLPTLLAPDIVPSFTPQEFADLGAIASGLPAGSTDKLALIELQNGNAPSSYYAGTQNFYVITRYNHSSYYAKAVIDLGEAVERAMRN